MKISLLYPLVICILLSCTATKPMLEQELVISIKTTPCFGTCPVYELKVYRNQTTTLKAERFMKLQGQYSSRLRSKQYNELIALFENSDFFSFEDSYSSNYTDLPTTYLRFRSGTKDKIITDYSNPPEALEVLENAVEALIEQLIWRKED